MYAAAWTWKWLCILWLFSHLVVSNSLRAHGLQPNRLLCLWSSPSKTSGVSCHFLLQVVCIYVIKSEFDVCIWASLVALSVKKLPAVQESQVQFLGLEDPLEKEMATHSSILA